MRYVRPLLKPEAHPVLSAESIAEMTRLQAGGPPERESYLLALDPATGKTLWKRERPTEESASPIRPATATFRCMARSISSSSPLSNW